MKIVFMGPQGAGKGTIAEMIKDKIGVPHISTGDMFREAIKEHTKLGKTAKKLIDDGKFVPDEITIKIVQERLVKPDCENGFLLDGFPRNLHQAEQLETFSSVDRAVLLDITDDLTVYRLSARRVCKNCAATYNVNPDGFPKPNKDGVCDSCGGVLVQRDDDKEDAIKERLRTYHNQTEPIIKFYAQKGVLREVDASRKVDMIVEDTLKALKQ
ncbi:MAG: adenylate kinase [Candidatus Nanoarchaeia archaeon]